VLVRGKVLPSCGAVVEELLRRSKETDRITIDPADYERIKPSKIHHRRPYPCRFCGEPATWKESFAARDRDGRCYARALCEECYQQATGQNAPSQIA